VEPGGFALRDGELSDLSSPMVPDPFPVAVGGLPELSLQQRLNLVAL